MMADGFYIQREVVCMGKYCKHQAFVICDHAAMGTGASQVGFSEVWHSGKGDHPASLSGVLYLLLHF